MTIGAQPFARKKFIEVQARRMAFIDGGEGDAIMFPHRRPTSSHLRRNVVLHCRGLGRLVACDPIGMGDSDKLVPSGPDRYTFAEDLQAPWWPNKTEVTVRGTHFIQEDGPDEIGSTLAAFVRGLRGGAA